MKLDNRTLKGSLLDYGLNTREIDLYISLLKHQGATVMELSRETEIKRSTVHNLIENLIAKGLVTPINTLRRTLRAEDPEKLGLIIAQKKWEISTLENRLPDIIDSIQQLKLKTKIITMKTFKVQIHESKFNSICLEVRVEAKDEEAAKESVKLNDDLTKRFYIGKVIALLD